MKKNKRIYYCINLSVLIFSVASLGYYLKTNEQLLTNVSAKIIILYILVNIFKFLKMYLLFLEEKIPFLEFLSLYIKTTFVNIVVPFKLGEIFSIYCYGYKIKNYKKAFGGLLVNRFIDTIIILLFMIPTEMKSNSFKISNTSILMLVFIIVFLIFLLITPSTYKYLNKVLIEGKSSKFNIKKLKVLNELKKWYDDCTSTLNGKVQLLFILSGISWILEYLLIKNLAKNNFTYTTFSKYINAAFLTETNSILTRYLLIASSTMFIFTIIIYAIKILKKFKKRYVK